MEPEGLRQIHRPLDFFTYQLLNLKEKEADQYASRLTDEQIVHTGQALCNHLASEALPKMLEGDVKNFHSSRSEEYLIANPYEIVRWADYLLVRLGMYRDSFGIAKRAYPISPMVYMKIGKNLYTQASQLRSRSSEKELLEAMSRDFEVAVGALQSLRKSLLH